MDVKIDITGYVEQVDQARSKDIPYATAITLTRVAQDAAIEVKRSIGKLFTLRNTWTQQNIRITPAQKLSWPIASEVYTDTGNATAPDYLTGQEDGEMKVPHNGHAHVAIPTALLRALIGPGRVIPDALRPNELLAAYTATHVSRRAKKAVKTRTAQQFVGFKQYIRGELYIMARRPDARQAQPFYLLTPEANVRPVLGMDETVDRVAAERFDTHWSDAWDSIGGE